MVEKDTRWSAVLENRGLLHLVNVLEEYGIGSETEACKMIEIN